MKIVQAALTLTLLSMTLSTKAQSSCEVSSFVFQPPQLADGTMEVSSKAAQIIKNEVAAFEGDVRISSSSALILADSAEISENGKSIQASGNVSYSDELLQVQSLGIEANAELDLLQLQSTQYKISGVNGRGGADLLSISKERGVLLEDVSFTTCPLNAEDWKIQASEISLKKDQPFGEAKNTRFYVGGVPVFYLPYFAFPVTTERLTGFLFPKIGSSGNTGVEYEQGYYWNIAPNVDSTLSARYMSLRGVQLKNEWRYLTENHQGEFNLEYLAKDRDTSSGDPRYFYRFNHQGRLGENWTISADISDISDNNYIVDLGSDYYNQADTHLYRQAGLSYFSENLDFNVFIKDFSAIGNFRDNYRALPEAKLNYATNLNNWLEFDLRSELAYFDNRVAERPDTLRVHIEPSLRIPYQKAWGELLAEVSLFHTYYDQDLTNVIIGENSDALEESVERTLGQARLFGSLVFEREQKLVDSNYLLTFEPKAQYLYTSYQDQFNIGKYDTTELFTTFSNIFRGQEFTGLDRINDNNQFTLGATARIIDDRSRELFVASLGQIFYLESSKLEASQRSDNRSALVAELDWRVNRHWFVHTDVQLGNETNNVERSSLSTEYRLSENRLIQINHRFIRELSNEKIDQFGISASWPINKNWHWVGRYYRDFERSRSTETLFGLAYESCCWGIRLTAQREIATRFNSQGIRDENEFESGISLQFVFKGIGSSSSNTDMLRQGLFGYRQPFVLN